MLDEAGRRVVSREAGRYDLESDMGRKVRVADARGGVPGVVPGDKLYRKAERVEGFYTSGGGVVAGSNWG